MKLFRVFIPVFLVLLVDSVGCAQSELASQTADKDARLDQKVTLNVTLTHLSEALSQLTKQTGVTMRAGGSARDWKVSERRISVRAKDIRLGDLMDQIAALTRFRYACGKKDGNYHYLFWQDKNQRELEADLLNAQREQDAQKATQLRRSALDTAEKALALTPETAQAMKERDPWMAFLGGTKTGRAYSSMLKLIASGHPDAWDLMLRGRKATISMKNVSAALVQATTEATQGGVMAAERKKHPEMPQLEPSTITIMPVENMGGHAQGMMGFGGMVMIEGKTTEGADYPLSSGAPLAFFPVTGNDTVTGKFIGKMMLAVEEGIPIEEVGKLIEKELNDPEVAAALFGLPAKSDASLPTDPALLREVDIKKLPGIGAMGGFDKEHKDQIETMDQLSKDLSMPVLLDEYSNLIPLGAFVVPGKQTLYKVLASFERSGYDWQITRGALLLKPTDWALRRSYMIPEKRMAYYRDRLAKDGAFSLDDLAAIAVELTDAQISNTLMTDPDLAGAVMGSLGNPMSEEKDILRIYGSLSEAQRKSLLEGSEVRFSQLNDDQYAKITDLTSSYWGGSEIVDGSFAIQKQNEDRKMFTTINFEFKAITTDQQEPLMHASSINILDKETVKRMKEAMDKAMKSSAKKDGKVPAIESAPAPAKKD